MHTMPHSKVKWWQRHRRTLMFPMRKLIWRKTEKLLLWQPEMMVTAHCNSLYSFNSLLHLGQTKGTKLLHFAAVLVPFHATLSAPVQIRWWVDRTNQNTATQIMWKHWHCSMAVSWRVLPISQITFSPQTSCTRIHLKADQVHVFEEVLVHFTHCPAIQPN